MRGVMAAPEVEAVLGIIEFRGPFKPTPAMSFIEINYSSRPQRSQIAAILARRRPNLSNLKEGSKRVARQ